MFPTHIYSTYVYTYVIYTTVVLLAGCLLVRGYVQAHTYKRACVRVPISACGLHYWVKLLSRHSPQAMMATIFFFQHPMEFSFRKCEHVQETKIGVHVLECVVIDINILD